jgi:hypothetical protein
MIRDTITQIEARLKNSDSLNDQTRQELVSLLNTLKGEVTELSRTDAQRAERIASYTETSTHEAMRPTRNPDTLQSSLDSLAGSVEGFENTHPNLVQIVNRICTTLSNLGI